MISIKAVYVMWLREMKRYSRVKARIISSIAMPLFFFAALGLGFSKMPLTGVPEGVNYLLFIMPGIIGMGLTTTSLMGGLSVIWDREFGFLKEIMVAPVSRLSIVLGRIIGGVSTSMIQGTFLLIVSLLAGFSFNSITQVLLFIIIMILISATFMGFGLILSSLIKDMQGFGGIVSLIVMPILFLSGAFFQINNLPVIVQVFSLINPLTYGVDALRGVVLGYSLFNPLIDLTVLIIISFSLIAVGSYLFNKRESA